MEAVRSEVRPLVGQVYESERRARDKLEMAEIRERVCDEVADALLVSKVDAMLVECSERVVAECRRERLEAIYEGVVEETVAGMMEKVLFEVIFSEMNPRKELIKKIETVGEELGRDLGLIGSRFEELNKAGSAKRPVVCGEVAKKRAQSQMAELEVVESPMKRARRGEEEPAATLVDRKKTQPSKIVKCKYINVLA